MTHLNCLTWQYNILLTLTGQMSQQKQKQNQKRGCLFSRIIVKMSSYYDSVLLKLKKAGLL